MAFHQVCLPGRFIGDSVFSIRKWLEKFQKDKSLVTYANTFPCIWNCSNIIRRQAFRVCFPEGDRFLWIYLSFIWLELLRICGYRLGQTLTSYKVVILGLMYGYEYSVQESLWDSGPLRQCHSWEGFLPPSTRLFPKLAAALLRTTGCLVQFHMLKLWPDPRYLRTGLHSEISL